MLHDPEQLEYILAGLLCSPASVVDPQAALDKHKSLSQEALLFLSGSAYFKLEPRGGASSVILCRGKALSRAVPLANTDTFVDKLPAPALLPYECGCASCSTLGGRCHDIWRTAVSPPAPALEGVSFFLTFFSFLSWVLRRGLLPSIATILCDSQQLHVQKTMTISLQKEQKKILKIQSEAAPTQG